MEAAIDSRRDERTEQVVRFFVCCIGVNPAEAFHHMKNVMTRRYATESRLGRKTKRRIDVSVSSRNAARSELQYTATSRAADG